MAMRNVVTTDGLRPASDHQGHSHDLTRSALRLGFFLTAAILVVELASGLLSHSLALLSDAAHVVTDVVAFGLAWFAAAQAERPANERRTFGYHRLGIIVALMNGLTLIALAIWIGFEAWNRLRTPETVTPWLMIVAALVAIAVNLFIVWRLHGDHENLNSRASALHALGDVGASVGVVVGAVVIALTGASWVDPMISLAIAILVSISAVRLIREASDILLESAPRGVSSDAVADAICSVKGILGVHDLHIWQISGGLRALSCHALIADIPPSASASLLDQVSDLLRERFSICHTTIQMESEAHEAHDGHCACAPGMADSLYCAVVCGNTAHAGHSHAAAH
jgi:cobalt-zinc-cadmium efflux system protein